MKKLLLLACLLLTGAAQAHIERALLAPLAGDDPDARVEAVGRIAALASDDAQRLLQALKNDALVVRPDGVLLIVDSERAYDPSSGATTRHTTTRGTSSGGTLGAPSTSAGSAASSPRGPRLRTPGTRPSRR